MKFDVSFDSTIKEPEQVRTCSAPQRRAAALAGPTRRALQVRRMIEYVRSVYDHKMEKLDDLLKFAASSPGGQRALRTSGCQRVSLSSNRLTRRTLLPRRAWR